MQNDSLAIMVLRIYQSLLAILISTEILVYATNFNEMKECKCCNLLASTTKNWNHGSNPWNGYLSGKINVLHLVKTYFFNEMYASRRIFKIKLVILLCVKEFCFFNIVQKIY